MKRIAVAGFQHETNSFAAAPTGWGDFVAADSWPGLLVGPEVATGTCGLNLPIAGFLAAAAQDPEIEVVPLFWCAAEPGGPVTAEAFAAAATLARDGLRRSGPVDGVYLDLHGAMIAEGAEDGEGAVLATIRAVLGPAVPIVASLDLHANLTARMAAEADRLAIFRTYPHLDMAETGARLLGPLKRLMGGRRPARAFRQAPFLIPLHAQNTGAGPARALCASLAARGTDPEEAVELSFGFPPGDVPDAGPALVAYAPTQARADALANALLADLCAQEAAFARPLRDAEAAVRAALAENAAAKGPVVVADVQDNPGAGAASDTTGLLRALVAQDAPDAVLALLCDPEMAAAAHEAGLGAVLRGPLGGKTDPAHGAPLYGAFRVEALGDGRCPYLGAMYGGGVAEIGPAALLRVLSGGEGVRVAVSSRRSQALDRGLLVHLGVDPAAMRVLCLKSTVHYRADFEPIAQRVIEAAAPGAALCDPAAIPYRRLRRGVRLGPGGPPFAPTEGRGAPSDAGVMR